MPADPAAELRGARELLSGFTGALRRFETAVRADALAGTGTRDRADLERRVLDLARDLDSAVQRHDPSARHPTANRLREICAASSTVQSEPST